ncbi:hypothetical protein AGDE_12595 [Angomonas deanei]|uniref:Uncharacterized protein n=1 Tax=Angomonas deanei TaxID=59799 RepID=A0A7G2C7L6_9TRYP|nr:hypothetical protein AGDE_12595 [Angomonas deanei]CAD2215094.1 hypothetical protein, conserved [Angomonas deanei]|eukprot:EPY23972.1 hypothetical protein AGDE_12595 [Angomonas deanei]
MGSKPSTDADLRDEIIEISKKKDYPGGSRSEHQREDGPKPIYKPAAHTNGNGANGKIGFKSREDGEEGKDIENKAFGQEKVKRVPTKGAMLRPPKTANSCVADPDFDDYFDAEEGDNASHYSE